MSAAGGGGIFVSYRREESSYVAGRLSDRLIDRFGAEQVFIDVEAIEPGADFAEAISRAVDACVVLLAVIGPGWLLAADERGERRLDDPDDLVRLEIGTALAREVRVIPVLVEGAVMPRRENLPEGLAGLARRNALRIRHESFRDDAGRLVSAIERVLASAAVVGGAEGARSAGDVSGVVVMEGSGAGRKDLARAARLAADAERIAYSTTDESEKAWLLSEVARAVAVTDPGRAARLAADAERIANTLTDESEKAWALSEVARAVAVTDPGRAARLAADAERIANTLTDESEKASALSGVAEVVAVTNPDRAERIANSITDEFEKALVLSAVAEAVAVTDPSRAARLAADAERFANTLTDERTKALVLSAVAEAVAVTDPGRAARLVADAERFANALNDGLTQARVLSAVVGAMALTDPGRAERIANSLTDEAAKASALSSIAKALAV